MPSVNFYHAWRVLCSDIDVCMYVIIRVFPQVAIMALSRASITTLKTHMMHDKTTITNSQAAAFVLIVLAVLSSADAVSLHYS